MICIDTYNGSIEQQSQHHLPVAVAARLHQRRLHKVKVGLSRTKFEIGIRNQKLGEWIHSPPRKGFLNSHRRPSRAAVRQSNRWVRQLDVLFMAGKEEGGGEWGGGWDL